jgi:methionine-rich copper-binding protein CopC
MNRLSRAVRPALLLAAAVTLAAWTAPSSLSARRHVSLKKSSPAANDTLASPPASIELWFSEKIEMKTSSIRLTTAAGAVVITGALTGQDSVAAPAKAPVLGTMGPGRYKLEWVAGSKDGHPAKGTIGFFVKAAH